MLAYAVTKNCDLLSKLFDSAFKYFNKKIEF
jgi:hypothetical protein